MKGLFTSLSKSAQSLSCQECRVIFCKHLFSTSSNMAWRSHGEDNTSLVENLFNNKIIKSEEVRDVMLQVDRGNYVKHNAYMDAPQRIGYNITISAPHMHGHALELLKDHLKPGKRALDVGSGSGYLTVCMALMVGGGGRAVGIDHIPELVEMGRDNIKKDGKDGLVESGQLSLVVGDGRKGWAEGGPYHAIHVGAAAATLPQELVDQLAPGGRMVIPVGEDGGDQSLDQVERGMDGKVTKTRLFGVRYVPLTDRERQWRGGKDEF